MRHRSGDPAGTGGDPARRSGDPAGTGGGPAGDICRQVRAVYDRQAESYAGRTRQYAIFPGLQAEVTDFVGSLVTGPVLDIGCGSGRDGRWIAELGRRVVYGDSAYRMLTATAGLVEPTRAVCCDVRALPFAARTFAGVLASGVLLHLPKAACAAALGEIRRVLTADGQTLLSMKAGAGEGWRGSEDFPQPRWFAYYRPAEFAALCAETGLAVRDVVVSHRRDWFMVTARRAR